MKRIEDRASRRQSDWRSSVVFAFVVAASLLLAACGGEGGVAGARAGFVAEMGSFSVVSAAAPAEAAAEGAETEAAAEAEAEGASEAEDAESAAALPETVTILLDFLIHNEGSGTLDGVTVDLTIADPDGNEKGRHLLWVDTAGLSKGSQRQVAHELADVAHVEGDGYHVEVRHPIPMEERGDYREFDAEN